MSFIVSMFKALAAIPVLVGYCESFASAISLWYIQRMNNAALSAIADAAAQAARATTDAERYAAAQAWEIALSKPRASS